MVKDNKRKCFVGRDRVAARTSRFFVIVAIAAVMSVCRSGVATAAVSCDWALFFSVGTLDCAPPNALFDGFSGFSYRTVWNPGDPLDAPDEPYWWTVLNNGYTENLYNAMCSSTETECLTHEREGANGFVRLEISPYVPLDPEWPEYHDVSLTEENNGFGYEQPRRWTPRPGRPVVLHARLRWSEAYHADGSGDFVGSSGINLWNYPVDNPAQTIHEVRSLGLDILSDDSTVSEKIGLGVTAVYQTEPYVYSPDVFVCNERRYDVDVNEWFTFTLVWSEDTRGNQTARFWIDDAAASVCELPVPFSALGVEAWVDNYVMTDLGDGTYSLGTGPVRTTQHMDVDYLGLMQPAFFVSGSQLSNLDFLKRLFRR